MEPNSNQSNIPPAQPAYQPIVTGQPTQSAQSISPTQTPIANLPSLGHQVAAWFNYVVALSGILFPLALILLGKGGDDLIAACVPAIGLAIVMFMIGKIHSRTAVRPTLTGKAATFLVISIINTIAVAALVFFSSYAFFVSPETGIMILYVLPIACLTMLLSIIFAFINRK